MKVLAFEFSTHRRSVSVGSEKGSLVEVVKDVGRETPVADMVEELLITSGTPREKFTKLAIGLGPGSYTGIRLSLAWAHGWSFAHGLAVVGVPSTEILLHELSQRPDLVAGKTRGILVFNAQRDEYYMQECARRATDLADRHEWELIGNLQIVGLQQLSELSGDAALIAPDPTRGLSSVLPLIELYPSASVLASIAATRSGVMDPGQLEPVYLRATSFVKAPPIRNEFLEFLKTDQNQS